MVLFYLLGYLVRGALAMRVHNVIFRLHVVCGVIRVRIMRRRFSFRCTYLAVRIAHRRVSESGFVHDCSLAVWSRIGIRSSFVELGGRR
jgi:hypothetical protein